MIELSNETLASITAAHIRHYARMVSAGERGERGIRLDEAREYLGIWVGTAFQVVRRGVHLEQVPELRDALSPINGDVKTRAAGAAAAGTGELTPEQSCELGDALACGDYDGQLTDEERRRVAEWRGDTEPGTLED